ncbi:hypothetical protein BDR26DRAFT_862924, partial [Obelidium mucronatum]
MIASQRDSPSSSVISSSNGSNFVGSSVSSPFSVSSVVSAMGLIASSSMSFWIFAHWSFRLLSFSFIQISIFSSNSPFTLSISASIFVSISFLSSFTL